MKEVDPLTLQELGEKKAALLLANHPDKQPEGSKQKLLSVQSIQEAYS